MLMNRCRLVFVAVSALMVSALPIHAQSPAYRDFSLGSPLTRIVEQLGATAPVVTLVHQRPAVLQDLQWRTPYASGRGVDAPRDPVQQIVFSFYQNQLFRMAVEYDRDQTDGMTDADMIAALSARYGSPLTPSTSPNASRPPAQASGEWSVPIAQWTDADVVVLLARRVFTAGFQVVVSSARLEPLARAAATESIRLDREEAPAKDLARQKSDADAARLAQEKARAANKTAFRP
jgi:hypothetical protein